jgi:hypothetical protein
MSLTTVLSISLIPSKTRTYEGLVRKIAERANQKRDAFQWRTYQVVAGDPGRIHFVSEVADFAALAGRDLTAQSLVLRLFGENDGGKMLDELAACGNAARFVIGRDRPDLSYPPDGRDAPMSVVTVLRVRPGHQDAAEELIRKLAEAIPKVDDPARLITYQSVIGDLRTLWTVRPIASLADLDRQLAPNDLLNKAFGTGEGGLIGRAGMEALESVERSILVLRADLSNPS